VSRTAIFGLLLTLAPGCLSAGPIYGSIFRNGAAVRRAPLTIVCGGTSYPGSTLDDGTYRINVQQTGRCTLTATVPGAGTASAEVVSIASAAQYNFQVVKGSSGFELRRQ